MPPGVVLTNHSLEKSEQKISKVLEELNASQNRERAVSEARKVDKATFEEATKRLEGRVSSLEGELDRSRESYVVWAIFRPYVLISSQRRPSEHTVAGMKPDYTTLRANPHGSLDDEPGIARQV